MRSQKSYRTPLIGIAVRLDERTRPLRLLPCVTSTRHRASVMTLAPMQRATCTPHRPIRAVPRPSSIIQTVETRECQCASVIPVMRNREEYHRTPSHPNPESQEWTTPRYLLPDIRIVWSMDTNVRGYRGVQGTGGTVRGTGGTGGTGGPGGSRGGVHGPARYRGPGSRVQGTGLYPSTRGLCTNA